jgi:hypothetical protein
MADFQALGPETRGPTHFADGDFTYSRVGAELRHEASYQAGLEYLRWTLQIFLHHFSFLVK